MDEASATIRFRCAEAGVVVVMVDVHDGRGRVEEARSPGPIRRCWRSRARATTRSPDVGRKRPAQLARASMKRVLGRERYPAEQVHDGVLAELLERELRGEHGSERVAVRVLVRDDEEAVVRRGSRQRSSAARRVCVGLELIEELGEPDCPGPSSDRTQRRAAGCASGAAHGSRGPGGRRATESRPVERPLRARARCRGR